MKKYTKLMGILLALVMLVALMPMTALADEPSPTPTPDDSGTIVGPVPYLPNNPNPTYPPDTNPPTDKTNYCDVVISKAVEGNNANVNDEFEFEVTFYMPKEEYERPIAYSANAAAPVRAPGAGNNIGIYKRFANGDTYEFRPGELTYEDNVSYEGLKKATLHFTLKHGESLSIIGLAIKNRLITVNELDSKGYLTTVNGIIGTQWKEEEPIADTIKVDFINTKESLPLSESLSVEKRWSDGNEKHMRESVTVQLYRNGEPYSLTMFGRVIDDGRAELNASNGWQHTWSGLDTGYKWTVAELNVPKGYVSTVNYYGGSAIITNTAASAGLPQTGDAQTPYIGAGLVLAAMAIVVIIAGKKRN
ncbi:MAG: Cna B-type domain-containing protein [Eubacteriales bacterium]|nr:Cna B-type domain-containing protein [Eubacteriales bacterium]